MTTKNAKNPQEAMKRLEELKAQADRKLMEVEALKGEMDLLRGTVQEAKQADLKKRQEEAFVKISALTKEARAKITEAENLADQTGVTFHFSVEYGMGGAYYPQVSTELKSQLKEAGLSHHTSYDGDTGWVSSSQNC